MASAALGGDLERLKDIFESDDCSIFIQRPGVEKANLPDVLEHWTLREYVELPFLRTARGSSRRHSLQALLLWMEGRESTEAFDFAFGPKVEYLDDLRTLTMKGKPFDAFSFWQWKSQLRLIEGCYSGQTGVVSKLLTVGAPDESSLLLTFKTVRIPHHPHVSSWPLRALLEARALGVAVAQLKEAIWDCRRLLRGWECHCASLVHHSVILFRPLQVRSLERFLCEES